MRSSGLGNPPHPPEVRQGALSGGLRLPHPPEAPQDTLSEGLRRSEVGHRSRFVGSRILLDLHHSGGCAGTRAPRPGADPSRRKLATTALERASDDTVHGPGVLEIPATVTDAAVLKQYLAVVLQLDDYRARRIRNHAGPCGIREAREPARHAVGISDSPTGGSGRAPIAEPPAGGVICGLLPREPDHRTHAGLVGIVVFWEKAADRGGEARPLAAGRTVGYKRPPVSEREFQLARGAAFVAAVLVAVGLQRLRPHDRSGGSWKLNGGLWATNLVVLGIVCGGCACSAAQWAQQHHFGLWNHVGAPAFVSIAGTVIFLDLVSYAWHRANHTLPLLWRAHRVHHSDRAFTASTAARFHPLELVLSMPLRLLAVLVSGASPIGVLVFEGVFTLANWLVHGDIDCPLRAERFLGHLLVTPALHRRHHGRDATQRDSNFGTIFSVWDRLLGTYAAADSRQRIVVGLSGPPPIRLLDALGLPFSG